MAEWSPEIGERHAVAAVTPGRTEPVGMLPRSRPAASNISPREQRLRARIDALQDERDALREDCEFWRRHFPLCTDIPAAVVLPH